MKPTATETAPTRDASDYPSGPQPGYDRYKFAPMRADAIAARLKNMEGAGWEDISIAVAARLPRAAVTQWKEGKHDPETTAALSAWLSEIDRKVAEKAAGFVVTPTAGRFLRAFEQAREPKNSAGRRGIALIFGASGVGKTTVAEWVARMDECVVYVLVDGECRTWATLMRAISLAMNNGHPPYRTEGVTLRDWIVRQLPPGSMIIFDHAHHLRRGIMEQMLAFPERHGIALALIGTADGYDRLVNKKMEQIKARVSGANVFVNLPEDLDVDYLMDADDIRGDDEQAFCRLIAKREGGLHYYANMVQEARKLMIAAGAACLDLATLKRGADNAGCWGAQE